MNTRFTLMYEDTPVLKCGVRNEVLNEKLLPLNLKGRIKEEKLLTGIRTRADLRQSDNISMDNWKILMDWFSGRLMNPGFVNARKLCTAMNLDPTPSPENTLKIAFACHAVSLLDHYWVKQECETVKWDDVNLFHNQWNAALTQIALHGSTLSVDTPTVVTPEFTTRGTSPKAWKRHADGSIWLYKLNIEEQLDIIASNLLDKMNVKHVKYYIGEDAGDPVCMCQCMTNDSVSLVPGIDFSTHCSAAGLNMLEELARLDADTMYKMWIVDYLISNYGRHGRNWGILYDPVTLDFIGITPMFDHNKAFDARVMKDADTEYIFTKKSYRQSAKEAMKHVNFEFTAPITCDDFLTDEMWKSFRSRAQDLGLM